MKNLLSLVILILFGTASIFAQGGQQMQQQQMQQQPQQGGEVSDEELENFAKVYQQLQVVDQQSQQKMVRAIEKEGISIDRFNEINQQQQNPGAEVDADADEMQKFQAAGQAVGKIQNETQEEMRGRITDEGLTLQRYQEISALIQSNPQIEQRFTSIFHSLGQ